MESSPKNLFLKIIAVKKIKMTLELLAQEMRTGFGDVYKRLDGVDKRLDTVDKRLDTVDKRLDTMEVKIDKKIDEKVEELAMMVKFGFDEMAERIDNKLDTMLEIQDKKYNTLNVRVDNLENRQDKFAEKLGILQRRAA